MASINYITNHSENILSETNLQKVTKIKATVWKKSALKTSKTAAGIPRSFGDISNQIGRTVTPKIGINNAKEKCSTRQKSSNCTEMNKVSLLSSFPGPEFRPEIKETEDYGDVLPEEFRITHQSMLRFKRLRCQERKAEIDECPPSPPPTYSLELLPVIESFSARPSVELKPVEDVDVFSLPPPMWEK